MDRTLLLRLIDKYLSNQCSAEEIQQIEDWYRSHDGEEDFLEQLTETNRARLGDALLHRIHSRMEQDVQVVQFPEPGIRKIPAFRRVRRSGLALLLILAACVAGWFLLPVSTKKYETAYGERNAITLPDGSRVVLNGHSTLRSNSNWSTSTAREVWLDGEAFFSVTHMKNNQRFVVHTSNGLSIEVLGTSFNVRKRDNNTQVVLREGKIRLSMQSPEGMDTLTMKPGDLVEISGQNRKLTREVVKPEKYTSWQNPNISFSETPLRDVLKMIQEVYGDEIVVTDSTLTERRITGSLPNDNLELLLKALEEILNCHIEHQNNRITLSDQKTH